LELMLHVVILAAGKGTRMRSARPKVLHRVAGAPMIDYVLAAASALHPDSTTIVVGHQAEALRAAVDARAGLQFVVQEPQLGTAHALLATEPVIGRAGGTVLLLSGDVPLLTSGTLQALVARHGAGHAAATVLTASVKQPRGYGRIIRSGGRIVRIVEERDAGDAERQITEVNAGIYAFALDGLFDALRSIAAGNAQREYYLPDLVEIYGARGLAVETVTVDDADEIRGVNSRGELAALTALVRARRARALMDAGVTLEDPAATYIDGDVEVGPDTILHPGVTLEGRTVIGTGCEIHSGTRIVGSRIGDRVTVLDHSLVIASDIGDDARVGPFAHFRGQVTLAGGARVGNFVELKNTTLGPGSKAMHLAYLGDASIGARVNVGAGTITCNYDGVTKSRTTIGDGAFIGSDSQLVAPVTIGEGAYVGSGATVREDVPPGALAVSAGRQRNIEGWVDKKKKARAKPTE
jgi:bifunctional UDP-N-acetylglucosamine pyrophosphorylase/glucosamine-1-phosphate N-acetyltransferase